MEAKDIRDWIAFVTGVMVPGILGIVLFGAELSRAPTSVLAAFSIAVGLFFLAVSIAIVFWHRLRSLKSKLGLVQICARDDAKPLHTVYRNIKHSYRWHGLSAVNELVGQTEVQAAILQRSGLGAEFLFVLADPRDTMRMTEQCRWEDQPARPLSKMIEHIEGSCKVIEELRGKGARVRHMSAARLPSFRIVEIDDDRIEVSSYDRGGCGYSGSFLVLRKPPAGDGLLYEWFRRAADLERKNAVVDEVYNEIDRLLHAGLATDVIVEDLATKRTYEALRRRFEQQFGWSLRQDTLENCVAFVLRRLSLERA